MLGIPLLNNPVYLYRLILDSVGGVSSTRNTSLAILDLEDGEVRQLQFVNDDTIMILWRNGSKSQIPIPSQDLFDQANNFL